MLDDLGKLVLRLVVAGNMIPHGISKLNAEALDGITKAVTAAGLPGFVAYGVYVGELVAPVLILIGLLTRPAAVVFAFNMVMAVALVHAADLLQLNQHGGWKLELQSLYFFGALAIALMGPGRLAVSGGQRWWQ